ncbi:MAG: helix-turn-helix domain-containing protein [Desulfuromonadaceae bacterium]
MMHDEYTRHNFPHREEKYKTRMALLVRGLRNFFGLTQNELSEISHVSRPTLSRMEKLEDPEKKRLETIDQILMSFADMGVHVGFIGDKIQLTFEAQAFEEAERKLKGREKEALRKKVEKNVKTL